MVEGTSLENRHRRESLVGSNPTPSATASAVFGILSVTGRRSTSRSFLDGA